AGPVPHRGQRACPALAGGASMSRYRLAILVLVSAALALLSGCRSSTNNCNCCCECEPQRQGLFSRLGFGGGFGFCGRKCGGTSCSSSGMPICAEPMHGTITSPPPFAGGPIAGGPIAGPYEGPVLPPAGMPEGGTYPGPFPPPAGLGNLPAPSPVPEGPG